MSQLGTNGSIHTLIVALGVDRDTYLFNDSKDDPLVRSDRSDLISLAKSVGCAVGVYSNTACNQPRTADNCISAEADAVVSTAEALCQVFTNTEEPVTFEVQHGSCGLGAGYAQYLSRLRLPRWPR